MKVLITGFEPFGNDEVNPSYEAVKKINLSQSKHSINQACLPVVFHQALKVLYDLIEKHQP